MYMLYICLYFLCIPVNVLSRVVVVATTEDKDEHRQHKEASRGGNDNTRRIEAVARRSQAPKMRRIEATTKRRAKAAKTRE